MNKFLVFPCIEQNDEGYQGKVVSLASTSNLTFVLFFPIAQEYADMINFVLKKENNSVNIKQCLIHGKQEIDI